MSMEVTGVKEFDKKLRSMASENGIGSVNKHFRKAVRKSAKEVMLPAAMRLAPELTGLTKKSLAVRAAKGKRGSVGSMVIVKPGATNDGMFYPAVQEFGSIKQNIPPKKFLRNAAYKNESRVQREFVQALRDSIAEAAE